MRRGGVLLPLVLAVALGLAACGGGTKTYSAGKTRACLVQNGRVVTKPPSSSLILCFFPGHTASLSVLYV